MESKIRRIRVWSRQIGCILILMLMLASSPLLCVSHSEAATDEIHVKPQTINIIVGESTIVRAPWPAVRVAITNPSIANVQVLTPDEVLLQGIKVGSTDLILWGEGERQTWQSKVIVRLDTARFKEKLDELFPHCSLQVSQSDEVLIVKGLLRSTEQVEQLHSYLDKVGVTYVDMTSVAGVQQVQLQVWIAEVSRTAIRALGINAFHTDDDYFGGVRAGGSSLAPISIGPPAGTVVGDKTSFEFHDDVSVGSLVTIFAGIPRADFELFLRALAENQYLRILANPTLVALSGEEASFLAGGEFPIPVPQGGTGATGQSITVEYKEFGVRLLFRPVVLGDGTIRLNLSPEVSELSETGAITIESYSVPSLITRKAQTTLELKSGQTFAMAGLIKSKSSAVASRIPGLSDVPVLGPLFRSVRYTKDETELVVMVTVSLVEPMSLAATPPLPGFLHTNPDDWELYMEGHIEGKEPAKIDSATADWFKKFGLGDLSGPGAWDSYGKPTSPSQAQTAPETEETKDIDAQNP